MKFILPLLFIVSATWTCAQVVDVYFGTGGGRAKGIYRATLDTATGKLSEPTLAAEVEAPGFLAFHPDRSKLYAVARSDAGPMVLAYSIGEGGGLTLLNSERIPDGEAAHLSVHPSGRFLLTAQYGGGSVALFPLDKDGRVEPCRQLIEHEGGSNVVRARQAKPHPHWTGFSADGRFAFVPDLGLDKIVIYQVQADQASIRSVGFAESVPGGGPRHMKFSIDGKYIFLLNELSLSLVTFAYDADAGRAAFVCETATLSAAMKAKENFNSASEVLVHPSGQFVYAANRGHDSVTAFQVDSETGHLYVADVEPIRGAWPRHINLDASGRWLLAAGAHSNTVSVFSIDPNTGALTYSKGAIQTVPNPICILLNDSIPPR